MRSLATLFLALGLFWSCAPSADDAAPADTSQPAAASGETVHFTSGPDTVSAYLARPGAEPHGVVVVIQEWWGLNDWVRQVADRFAERGYLAIAPDLYRGQVAEDMEQAHELSRGLPEERAIADLHAALAYARAQAGGEPAAAFVGFCMGGRLALLASLDGAPVSATVVCYGKPETSVERLRTLDCAVLGIFGADDRGIGPDQVSALENALESAGVPHEIIVYDGAGHAFLNDTRPSYSPDQAPRAWEAIDAFLATKLGS